MNLMKLLNPKSSLTLAAATLLLQPVSLWAQDKAQQLYTRCVQCHGADGMGNVAEGAPKIAGQHDWYILSSLKDFKQGVRKNAKMMPFISDLGEEDFKALAAYVSKMPTKPAAAEPAAPAEGAEAAPAPEAKH